ncbi:Uncharacterized membrane protein [Agrococcus baldri]|uniref:Uncharacterized membrane protein n=1 Tax=Agrococcus baldri TaxID=153730 RepID=A0AA94HPH1_9MICO|nr:vitamin K epoxide reductase family protein [Agrococcus baldri]SFS17891.1 Uncharacterized membrane protein [Agrococcus baldri]
MSDARPAHFTAPLWLGVLLIITGLAGLLGAFALSVDKIELLENPQASLGCDFNPFLTCSGAMGSQQGEAFGFPNPFLGLMAFPAPIIMGALTLGRVAMPRWVWTVFSLGVLGGLAFVLWLAQQSIFFLGFVCPWCFLVWMAMYAMSFPLWVWGFGSGALPAGAGFRRVAARFTSWGWVLSLALAVIVVLTIMIALPGIPRYLFSGF